MEDLRKARAEHNLDRRLRVYLAPKVLVVDEFGIWPYDRDAATAFFTLVSARYERGSIILTSNKGFGEWGELLGDTVIASAVLDRLLHHSHVLNIPGGELPAPGETAGRNLQFRITCWEQHRRTATTTIPTDRVAAQHLSGSILARRSCESTSRRWVNSRSAVTRTGTWWVRLPSAIPGHFSVGVDVVALR